MEIKDKEMLHIHIKGIHDDIWQVGNELLVDENYNSHLTNIQRIIHLYDMQVYLKIGTIF